MCVAGALWVRWTCIRHAFEMRWACVRHAFEHTVSMLASDMRTRVARGSEKACVGHVAGACGGACGGTCGRGTC